MLKNLREHVSVFLTKHKFHNPVGLRTSKEMFRMETKSPQTVNTVIFTDFQGLILDFIFID